MTSNIVTIRLVYEDSTRRQMQEGQTCWKVLAEIEGDRQRPLSLQTCNPWLASLAQHACDNSLRRYVVYRDTGDFDKELLNIDAEPQRVPA